MYKYPFDFKNIEAHLILIYCKLCNIHIQCVFSTIIIIECFIQNCDHHIIQKCLFLFLVFYWVIFYNSHFLNKVRIKASSRVKFKVDILLDLQKFCSRIQKFTLIKTNFIISIFGYESKVKNSLSNLEICILHLLEW